MSLTDKVIKNTFYLFLAQVLGFITPFILTPIIISYIGNTEFGIYAIVLGFLGTFGLFDMSLSTSFVKFISEYYNKRQYTELNNVINTGFLFYLLFSFVIALLGFIFSGYIVSLINIPPELVEPGINALHISLIIFFIANSTSIFLSVLISLQKMYLNSIINIFINFINVAGILLFLHFGYRLNGILISNLATVILSASLSVYLAKRELPALKLYLNFDRVSFKKMFSFGLQMQVAKLSSFASEKYDEFLLGYFSVLSNVTFFNLAGRVTRLGKFVPLQLFQQAAPIAAELNAREDNKKLEKLYYDAAKYLTFSAVPIFLYIFVFSDLIITAWMGPGYEISGYLIKLLAAGQLVNLSISAPGNSIIPNLGYPKFQMREGLISLGLNLILSFILIKYYGIVGAAIGNMVSTVISSAYIYYTSAKFFKQNILKLIKINYFKPLLISIICVILTYTGSVLLYTVFPPLSRFDFILYLLATFGIFMAGYIWLLFKSNYLNNNDKNNLKKFINHFSPVKLKTV